MLVYLKEHITSSCTLVQMFLIFFYTRQVNNSRRLSRRLPSTYTLCTRLPGFLEMEHGIRMQEYRAELHSMDAALYHWRRAALGYYYRMQHCHVLLCYWRQAAFGYCYRTHFVSVALGLWRLVTRRPRTPRAANDTSRAANCTPRAPSTPRVSSHTSLTPRKGAWHTPRAAGWHTPGAAAAAAYQVHACVTTERSQQRFRSLKMLRNTLCPRLFAIWKLALNIRILQGRNQFVRAREVVEQWHLAAVLLNVKRKMLTTNAQERLSQWLKFMLTRKWETWQAYVKKRYKVRRVAILERDAPYSS
jgi:hypothetical protein